MAKFEITAPDGARYEVEGENEQGALAALQSHLGSSAPAAPPSQWENFKRGLSALIEDPRRVADLDMVKSATGTVQTPTNVATGKVGVPQSFGPETPDAQAEPAIGFGANTAMLLGPGAPSTAKPTLEVLRAADPGMGPIAPRGPLLSAPAPMTLTVRPSGVEPSGPEAVAAAQRLSEATGEAVPVSKAIASDSMATQRIAAGLRHIPLAGDALVKSGEETAAALGRAADRLAADRGALPPEAAGGAAKEGLADFVGPRTDAELSAAYNAVPNDPAVKGPLENTALAVKEILAERGNAELEGPGGAVGIVKRAVTPRQPEAAPTATAAARETIRAADGSEIPSEALARVDELLAKKAKPAKPLSLAEYIAANGGLELTPDAVAAGFDKFRTGKGLLARKGGKSVDGDWRHELMEEGYLPRDPDGYHSRDIRGELFDKLEAEAKHGQKSYSAKDEASGATGAHKPSAYEQEVEAQAKRIRRELSGVGVKEGIDNAGLYDAAEALVHGHESDPLTAYENSVTALGAHGAVPDRSVAAAAAKPKGEPPHLNYEGIKRLRSEVGKKLSSPPEAGVDRGELKRIYRALSDDLKAAAAANGGEAQFKAANDLTRQRKVEAKLLSKVIGTKADAAPAAVYDRLVAMAGSASRADTARLALARKSMNSDAWKSFVGGLIGRLGREPDGRFSPARFHTAYSKLSDSGKKVLFDGELRQALDDIATVAVRMKRQERFGNPSGTAQNTNLVKVVGGLLTDFTATLSAIAGGHVVARMLASPATAKPAAQLVKAAAAATVRPSPERSAAVQAAAEALSRALVSNLGVRVAANDLAMIAPPRPAAASGRVQENNEQRKRR